MKIISVIRNFAFMAIALLAVDVPALAQKVTVDNIVYKVDKNKGTAELVKGLKAEGHVVIPEKVTFEGRDYKVTSIGDGAFVNKWGSGRNRNLTGITIPNSVTSIGVMAFGWCVLLKEITIPNSVTKMGYAAFDGCTSLGSIVVPDQEPQVEKGNYKLPSIFNGCEQIRSVRGHTLAYPQYVYNCGERSKNNHEYFGWLDSDCPFMKYTYPQLAANGFHATQKTPAAMPELAQQTAAPAQLADKVPPADVDVNVPASGMVNDNTFAVIIGNENYKQVAKVDYALNDARVFAEYCQKTLGLPESNVRSYPDATYGIMMSAIDDIKQIAKVYGGDLNVIFYYAGHGVPNKSDHSAYLLPVDVDGTQTNLCLGVGRLYQELAALNARNVVVLMDACFSGAQRGEGMLASARGVALKVKSNAPQGNMVAFTAATSDETAYPYKEKGHGMFTYYLLKKLQETRGEATLGELC